MDKFVCAKPLEVNVSCISSPRDLLDLQRFNEIPIVRPGQYWRRTREGMLHSPGRVARSRPVRLAQHGMLDRAVAIDIRSIVEAGIARQRSVGH